MKPGTTTRRRAARVYPRDGRWAEAIDAYIAHYTARGVSPQSVNLREYQLCRLSTEVDTSLVDITQDDLERWLTSHDWSAATRRAARSACTTFFRWAAKTGRIDTDPAVDLPGFESTPPNPKPVPEADYVRVVAQCPPSLRMAIRLGGELGMRRGEVAAVHRSHLSQDQDGWTLEVLGKGRKTRFLPMSDEFAQALVEHIKQHGGHGWAFPSRGHHGALPQDDLGHVTPHWLGTLVARELPPGYSMHKLRHRAATQIHRRSGGNLLIASELLGHSNVGTTQIYVAPDRSQLRTLTAGLSEARR